MIEKIQQYWQELDKKQQFYGLISAAILVIWLLFMLLFLPIKMQNETLKNRLQIQADISQKLKSVSNKNIIFSPIRQKDFKSIVYKIAQQKSVRISLKISDNKLILTAKNQLFYDLKNLLILLREKYAITTSKASITKTKDGFVNADLTLNLP